MHLVSKQRRSARENVSGFEVPSEDEVYADLELLVSARDRGPSLLSCLPHMLQACVPADPHLINDPIGAALAFVDSAIAVAAGGDEVTAKAMSILVGAEPANAAARASREMFKTERCAAIGDLYARHRRQHRSAKVVARSVVPDLLLTLTATICRLEQHAIEKRNSRFLEKNAKTMSWNEFGDRADQVSKKLEGQQIDAVVAIARGGLPLGVRLAHLRNVGSFGSVTAWKCPVDLSTNDPAKLSDRFEAIGLPAGQPSRVLIVDDVVGAGETMRAVGQLVQDHYSERPPDVLYAALYALDGEDAVRPDVRDKLCVSDDPAPSGWIDLPWERHGTSEEPAGTRAKRASGEVAE